MADAKLTLGFDTSGAIASLTAFTTRAKSILSQPLTTGGQVKGLEDSFGNLQKTKSGLDGVAKSLGSTGLALLGIGTGVALFHQLGSAIETAAEAQRNLNKTLLSFDSSPVVGALDEANNALATMADRVATVNQKATTFGKQTASAFAGLMLATQMVREAITGQTPEEDAIRARARSDANIAFEEGQKQRKLLAASAATKLGSLQLTQSDSLARGDLAGAKAGAKAIEEQLAATGKAARDALESEHKLQRARLEARGLDTGALEKTQKQELLNLDEDLLAGIQKRTLANARSFEDLSQQIDETQALRQRLDQDLATLGQQAAANDQQRAAQRQKLGIDTTAQIREAERGLAQDIADAQGRILNDVTETGAARRQEVIATARAEVDAIQASTTARLRGLGGTAASSEAQLATLTGLPSTPDVERRRTTLLGQIQQTQAQITEVAREGAAARATVEIKTAAELRQLQIKEAGERLALLRSTLSKENALRNEARGLLDQALGNQKDVDEHTVVNKFSLERDVAAQKRKDERILGDLDSGRNVNQMEAQAALRRRAFQEQLQKFGGLGAAMDVAKTTPGSMPGELQGAEQFREAREQIATLNQDVVTSIKGIKGAFQDGFGEVPGMMKDLWAELVGIAEAGKSQLAATITSLVKDELARAFADAQRRS